MIKKKKEYPNLPLGIGAWSAVEQRRTCGIEDMQVCSHNFCSRNFGIDLAIYRCGMAFLTLVYPSPPQILEVKRPGMVCLA